MDAHPLPQLHFFHLTLPTYFVYMSVLLSGIAFFVYHRAIKQNRSVSQTMDLFLIATVSGAIGARLFHIIYEEPSYYLSHPVRIFYFWQGGFVYYAGLIAGALAGFIAVKKMKQPFLKWADFFTPAVSLGYGLGRGACFLEGCCYGKYCDLPWAVAGRHPTQLYALLLELGLFVFVICLEKKKTLKRSGQLFMTWLLLHGLSRIVIEMFRDDDRGFLLVGLSISTVISLCLVLLSLFYFVRKPK